MNKSFFLIITIFLPLFVSALVFDRNLSFGLQGEDVRELQRILNKNPITRVAVSGPGSLGSETNYFGQMTRTAVIKFQELYAPEVLFPIGLYKGTGFIGQYTLAKLNKISESVVSNPQNSINLVASDIPDGAVPQSTISALDMSVPNITTNNSAPKVLGLSRYNVSRGSDVTVFGSNFDYSDNSIYFLGVTKTIDSVSSKDGATLSFTVPEWLPYGSYNLSILNKNGNSFDRSFGNYFSVSEKTKDLPKVMSVEPSSLSISSEQIIVIKGENFDKENNRVFSELGLIENIPSTDGKTIKINLRHFPSFSQVENIYRNIKTSNYSLNIFLNVQTSVGLSSQGQPISLEF